MQDTHKELVSIIVSVYNVEVWLPTCLESIAQQTYNALEIILIDDESTDTSGLICDSFASKEPRARVIHQENRGLWAVRNRGQAEAKGEYLVFTDGDDRMHKDFVRLLYEAINKDGHHFPLAICGFTRDENVFDSLTPDEQLSITVLTRDQLMESFFNKSFETHINMAANWNKLYRKAYLNIPFQKDYRRCQDTESNLRAYLTKIDHAICIDMPLYYWRIHSGQLTSTSDDELIRAECRSRLFYQNFKDLPDMFKDYEHYLLFALYRRLFHWKISALGTDGQSEVFAKVSKYEKSTFKAFIKCGHEPFIKKVHLLILLHFPRLTLLLSRIWNSFIKDKRIRTIPRV